MKCLKKNKYIKSQVTNENRPKDLDRMNMDVYHNTFKCKL